MRRLLRDVVCTTSISMLPIASECLAQNRIEWLLQAFGLLVESRQVPLADQFHPNEGIVLNDCLRNDVSMVERVREFVEEGTRLEDKRW